MVSDRVVLTRCLLVTVVCLVHVVVAASTNAESDTTPDVEVNKPTFHHQAIPLVRPVTVWNRVVTSNAHSYPCVDLTRTSLSFSRWTIEGRSRRDQDLASKRKILHRKRIIPGYEQCLPLATPFPSQCSDVSVGPGWFETTIVFVDTSLELLASFPSPLNIVTINGPARRGKSTFLNHVLELFGAAGDGYEHVFVAREDTETVTVGIWMWGMPIRMANGQWLLILDSQGLALGDKTITHKLVSISTLLSSTLIFLVDGMCDTHDSDTLAVVQQFVRIVAHSLPKPTQRLLFPKLLVMSRMIPDSTLHKVVLDNIDSSRLESMLDGELNDPYHSSRLDVNHPLVQKALDAHIVRRFNDHTSGASEREVQSAVLDSFPAVHYTVLDMASNADIQYLSNNPICPRKLAFASSLRYSVDLTGVAGSRLFRSIYYAIDRVMNITEPKLFAGMNLPMSKVAPLLADLGRMISRSKFEIQPALAALHARQLGVTVDEARLAAFDRCSGDKCAKLSTAQELDSALKAIGATAMAQLESEIAKHHYLEVAQVEARERLRIDLVNFGLQQHDRWNQLQLRTIQTELAITNNKLRNGQLDKEACLRDLQAAGVRVNALTANVNTLTANVNEVTSANNVLNNKVQELNQKVANFHCHCGSCFTGDAPVRMADGSTKPISLVRVGDWVRAPENGRARVLSVEKHPLCGRQLISINGLPPFFTEEHAIEGPHGRYVASVPAAEKEEPSLKGKLHQLRNGTLVHALQQHSESADWNDVIAPVEDMRLYPGSKGLSTDIAFEYGLSSEQQSLRVRSNGRRPLVYTIVTGGPLSESVFYVHDMLFSNLTPHLYEFPLTAKAMQLFWRRNAPRLEKVLQLAYLDRQEREQANDSLEWVEDDADLGDLEFVQELLQDVEHSISRQVSGKQWA